MDRWSQQENSDTFSTHTFLTKVVTTRYTHGNDETSSPRTSSSFRHGPDVMDDPEVMPPIRDNEMPHKKVKDRSLAALPPEDTRDHTLNENHGWVADREVFPGAYREGNFGGRDADTTTFVTGDPTAEGRRRNNAEDSEMPVAKPISAELVKDGCFQEWWSRKRNRFVFVAGLLVIVGGLVGLVLGLLLPLNTTATTTYTSPLPDHVGVSWGEPHVVTFDNLKYDCHGKGEFVLVRATDQSFEVQGRFTELHDAPVSRILAVAISEEAETPVIQLSFPENPSVETGKVGVCPLDLYVDGIRRNVLSGSGQDHAVEVTVSNGRVDVLYESSGAVVSVDVMASSAYGCYLNVFVGLPDANPSLSNIIGLMGTPNNETGDDWMNPDGNTLQLPSSQGGFLHEPAHAYCTENWCLRSEQESLFTYEDGFALDDYENCATPYHGSVDLSRLRRRWLTSAVTASLA